MTLINFVVVVRISDVQRVTVSERNSWRCGSEWRPHRTRSRIQQTGSSSSKWRYVTWRHSSSANPVKYLDSEPILRQSNFDAKSRDYLSPNMRFPLQWFQLRFHWCDVTTRLPCSHSDVARITDANVMTAEIQHLITSWTEWRIN